MAPAGWHWTEVINHACQGGMLGCGWRGSAKDGDCGTNSFDHFGSRLSAEFDSHGKCVSLFRPFPQVVFFFFFPDSDTSKVKILQ